MGLGGIFRGARNSLVATGLAAVLATGVGNRAGADEGRGDESSKRASARYEYSVESHIAGGSSLLGGKKPVKKLEDERYNGGRIKEGEERTIRSVGNYSSEEDTIDTNDKISLDFETSMKIDREKGHLVFGYIVTPKFEDKRLPSDKRLYREHSADSHAYFVLPRSVKLKGVEQMVKGYNHSNNQTMNLFAIPLDERLNKDFMTVLESFNKALVIGREPDDSESEVEKAFDNLMEAVPGSAGDVIGYIKDAMEILEEKRVEDLQKRFPGQQIIPMPFNQANGNPFGYTIFGRATKLFLDMSKGKEGEMGRIVIPNLSFTRDMNGTTEIANIEGLEYEFLVGKGFEKSLEGKVGEEKVEKENYKFDENSIYDGWFTSEGELCNIFKDSIEKRSLGLGSRNNKKQRIINSKFDGKDFYQLEIKEDGGRDVEPSSYLSLRLISPSVAVGFVGSDPKDVPKDIDHGWNIMFKMSSDNWKYWNLGDLKGSWTGEVQNKSKRKLLIGDKTFEVEEDGIRKPFKMEGEPAFKRVDDNAYFTSYITKGAPNSQGRGPSERSGVSRNGLTFLMLDNGDMIYFNPTSQGRYKREK